MWDGEDRWQRGEEVQLQASMADRRYDWVTRQALEQWLRANDGAQYAGLGADPEAADAWMSAVGAAVPIYCGGYFEKMGRFGGDDEYVAMAATVDKVIISIGTHEAVRRLDRANVYSPAGRWWTRGAEDALRLCLRTAQRAVVCVNTSRHWHAMLPTSDDGRLLYSPEEGVQGALRSMVGSEEAAEAVRRATCEPGRNVCGMAGCANG